MTLATSSDACCSRTGKTPPAEGPVDPRATFSAAARNGPQNRPVQGALKAAGSSRPWSRATYTRPSSALLGVPNVPRSRADPETRRDTCPPRIYPSVGIDHTREDALPGTERRAGGHHDDVAPGPWRRSNPSFWSCPGDCERQCFCTATHQNTWEQFEVMLRTQATLKHYWKREIANKRNLSFKNYGLVHSPTKNWRASVPSATIVLSQFLITSLPRFPRSIVTSIGDRFSFLANYPSSA